MDQKDPSGKEADFVRVIVQESTPMAMTAREVGKESEKDPEMRSVRYYIQSGDWSQCKMSHYLSVKNELCTIRKLVMHGTRIVIPQSLRSEELRLAQEGHQGSMKMKNTVENERLVSQNRP